MPLSTSKKFTENLSSLGLETYEDVLLYLPTRYTDYSLTRNFPLKRRQKAVLFGNIVSKIDSKRLKSLSVTNFTFKTADGYFYKTAAYNRPYLRKQLKENGLYTMIASYDAEKKRLVLLKIVEGAVDEDKRLKAVYRLPPTIRNYQFSKLVARILNQKLLTVKDGIPPQFRLKYRFIDKIDALRKIHFPTGAEDIRVGLRVLKYEEAYLYALDLIKVREEAKNIVKTNKKKIDFSEINKLVKTLDFKLTEDQKQAIREIGFGMDAEQLMYRLLQGDVGSGKTIVAILALYANYLRGDQGAFMAPTEILAEQHYKVVSEVLKDTGIQMRLLTGSANPSVKRQIKESLLDGVIDIIVGTHAAFSEDVVYQSLGLAIIDEQQRFGVRQRDRLINKGKAVDVLMMTATPIPRTLAMTIYGDIDISSLIYFPYKKRNVETDIVAGDSPLIDEKISKSVRSGHRVFIVAPQIGEEDDDTFTAESLYNAYKKKYPKETALVHGRMSIEEKHEAFSSFKNGITPILISTSIIEVGIDVREADLLVVYEAGRFGLSALHQLRGRIGRDGSPAVCLLVSDDEEDNEKLAVLKKEDDGFRIAEFDLKYRGPGDIAGIRQSGLPELTYLNLAEDYKFITYARQDAEEMVKNGQR